MLLLSSADVVEVQKTQNMTIYKGGFRTSFLEQTIVENFRFSDFSGDQGLEMLRHVGWYPIIVGLSQLEDEFLWELRQEGYDFLWVLCRFDTPFGFD